MIIKPSNQAGLFGDVILNDPGKCTGDVGAAERGRCATVWAWCKRRQPRRLKVRLEVLSDQNVKSHGDEKF